MARLGGYMCYSRHVVKGGPSSKSLLKSLETTFRLFAGKHRLLQEETWSAKYHQNTRFEGFLKEAGDDSVATSGVHVFCINRSVQNMNNKNPARSGIKAAFHCGPVHVPHDDHGWKSRRGLTRFSSRSLRSSAPVSPSSSEARTHLPLKGITLRAPDNSHR